MKVKSIDSFFRNSAVLLTALMLWALTSSCEEEYPEPMFTSSVIQGRINLGYGSDGPLDNFIVTAQGPYPEKITHTNSSGEFQLDGLGNGTYRLEIRKEGYGTNYKHGIQLFGSDTAWVWVDGVHQLVTNKLPKILTVETRLTSYSWLQEKDIAITTNKTSGVVPARVFMADFKDVNYKNYQWTAVAHSLHRNGYDNLMFHVDGVPFESGKEIYLILYICNTHDQGYLDYYTGIWTFSTLEPEERSQVMNFVMP